jgi:leucyl/phenylalanyl-tRNA--protein transferase
MAGCPGFSAHSRLELLFSMRVLNLQIPKCTDTKLVPKPSTNPSLPWLQNGQNFPPTALAWGQDSDAPGLLCAGGGLDAVRLQEAYAHGIFPWFSAEQPVLWWSPDPRMVLQVDEFRVHLSLKKTLRKFANSTAREIRFDTAFNQVIHACAHTRREGQGGTWILPEMVAAYQALHQLGLAHSVETWVSGRLVGGLYCVALGRAVFGESMFRHEADASKIALAALIGFCRQHHIPQIDCQQNTRHLASLGAREVARQMFEARVADLVMQTPPIWKFSPIYWNHVIDNL